MINYRISEIMMDEKTEVELNNLLNEKKISRQEYFHLYNSKTGSSVLYQLFSYIRGLISLFFMK